MNVRGRAVMVMGCTSDAGKSFLVTALCRALADQGLRVAPFKAQNMSNNAAVTPDGAEIGRAQYLQALAARAVPSADMNPVLLKPTSDTHSHIVLLGKPAPEVEQLAWAERPRLTLPVVERSLSALLRTNDVVVIEGAGSPAEVNLRESDIVNFRVARMVDAAVYLVVDIDRGGSFAHLLGTWECLEPDERALVRGFVLNKFRGDPLLLGDGPAWLERRTGVPVVAVVPWIRHTLPEEDRLIIRGVTSGDLMDDRFHGSARLAIVGYPYAANVDEFDVLSSVADLTVTLVGADAALSDFDIVVLPGSRNSAASLQWLREVGLDAELSVVLRRGAVVFGVCGGMQMLGHSIADEHALESGPAVGLSLLDVDTSLQLNKVTRQVTAVLLPVESPVTGYEIHHGTTIAGSKAVPILSDGLGWMQPVGPGTVIGAYVHGLLEDHVFRTWLLARIGIHSKDWNWAGLLDDEISRIAERVKATGLVAHVLASGGIGST